MNDYRLRAEREPWNDSISFMFIEKLDNGHKAYGTTVVMQTIEQTAYKINEPTFRLSMEAAQVLIDNLWDCGLRPSEGSGSAGALAATQAHLKDMQQLTFRLLDDIEKKA